VLLATAALHTIHARAEHGFARWWHGAHVAMAVGMIAMFLLPHADHAYAVLAVVFGAHAAAMAMALPRVTGIDRRVWVAAVLDGICMTYMLVPWRVVAVTAATVTYLAAASLAWASVPRGLMTPQRAASGAAMRADGAATETQPRTIVRFAGDLTTSVRLTLTAMALIMAWMLLSMQLASSEI